MGEPASVESEDGAGTGAVVLVRVGPVALMMNGLGATAFTVGSVVAVVGYWPDLRMLALGLLLSVIALVFWHHEMCRVTLERGRLVIFGRVFRREMAAADVCAVDVGAVLYLYLSTGAFEDVEFVEGATAPLARRRAAAVVARLRTVLGVDDVPGPEVGPGTFWCSANFRKGVVRTINWPDRRLVVVWAVVVVGAVAAAALRG